LELFQFGKSSSGPGVVNLNNAERDSEFLDLSPANPQSWDRYGKSLSVPTQRFLYAGLTAGIFPRAGEEKNHPGGDL
jgi:hypothetical protein